MDDRTLLELAAKAAGIGQLDFDYAKDEVHEMYFGPRLPMPQGVLMAAMHAYWNPLEDDGDALRLAVKLDILEEAAGEIILSCNKVGDKYQNTRHAIVRLAAEIGKTMVDASLPAV